MSDTATPAKTASHEAEAGGVLTIDLGAIAANWRLLRDLTAPAECAAVVKANAYGCGIEQVVPALARAGCKTFFVANLSEARRARTAAPTATVYVLNGLMPNTAPAFAAADLRPVLNSMPELAEWDAFVTASGWHGGAALHVDTGMNRFGLSLAEAFAIAPRLRSESRSIALVMSHLACADVPGHALTDTQLGRFGQIQTAFRGLPCSLANSAGIFLGKPAHADLVRPGIALFGGNPLPDRRNPMRPVVELKGRIAQVREVGEGETVGYGAAWTASQPARVAIVTVGYGDGLPRAAGATAAGKAAADVMVAGRRCPLVGRVSMDLLAVDISNLPATAVRRGDFVTLVGDGIDIDQLGAACGTIGYEVLTSLGKRYHRRYQA